MTLAAPQARPAPVLGALDRYRALFDNVSDMAVLIAREGDGGYRCLDANDAVSRMEGIPLDVILGKRVDEIHPPHVYAEWKAIYDKALATGIPLDVDHDVPSPLGVRRRRTRFIALGTDAEGRELLLGLCQDLTDFHLARSEKMEFERYRSAMNRLNGALEGDRQEEDVLRECVEIIRDTYGADRCLLAFLCDPEGGKVSFPFAAERQSAVQAPWPGEIDFSSGPQRDFLKAFLKRPEPVVLVPGDLAAFSNADTGRFQAAYSMTMPILPKAGMAWSLVMQERERTNGWTAAEKLLFKDMASRIKSALDSFVLTRSLRRSEAFHNLLTEMMPQLLWTGDAAGKVDFVNRRFREFTDMDDPGEIGEGLRQIHPEDLAREQGRWRKCLAEGVPFEAEMRMRRRDGEFLWHIVRAQPLRNSGGEIERWVGTCTDIDEAKRLQQELARSKEELEAIMGGVDEGISAQDATGRLIYANRKYAEFSGFRNPEELLASPLSERAGRYLIFDEQGNPIDFERLPGRRVLKGEESAAMVMRFRDIKLDRELWLNAKSTAVRDADGKVAMAINFAQDITEARKGREELIRSREQLSGILAGIADSIIAQTPDGRIVYANEAAARLLEFPSPEALIEATEKVLAARMPNQMVFLDEEGREVPLERLPSRQAREGIQPPPALLRFRMHPKAKERWVIAQAKPLFDKDGRVSLVLGMSQDITELKEKEEAVRRLQKMDSLGKLAGGIAHDFNNLLVSINGYSDLGAAASRESAPVLHEYFSEIRRSGERAAALTQQLLAYGRKQIVQPRALNLNAIVADMDKLFRRLIGEDIELRSELAEALPSVSGDASQMEQVIMNLVLNARDAMPRGGILTLRTGTLEVDERHRNGNPGSTPGPHVVLAVSDTGTGIDPAIRERIFEPFFTTKETGKGTGLGLASVYGIISQWSGHITVESYVGAGSTFRVLLPAIEGPPEPVRPRASTPQFRVAQAGTILVVEDEDSVLRFASRVLENRGFAVLKARNASEAMELARGNKRIDLMLTDVVMPDQRGTDLLGRIRELRPDLKAILMSGYIDPEGTDGVEFGRTEFLQKPFPPEALLLKVGRLIPKQ